MSITAVIIVFALVLLLAGRARRCRGTGRRTGRGIGAASWTGGTSDGGTHHHGGHHHGGFTGHHGGHHGGFGGHHGGHHGT